MTFKKNHKKIYFSQNLRNFAQCMLNEISVVDRHRCHIAAKFNVFVDEDHSKLPTLYWLPTLNKRPYKSCLIANSSLCTTTELSITLTTCLIAIKNIVKLFLREMVKLYFGL